MEQRARRDRRRDREIGEIGGTPSPTQAARYYQMACDGGYRTACDHVTGG